MRVRLDVMRNQIELSGEDLLKQRLIKGFEQ